MKKKNLLKGLLVSFMLLCAAQTWAYDFYDFSAKNDNGVTIYYNITSEADRTCEVTCYNTSDAYANQYSGSIEIPSSVTHNSVRYIVIGIDSYAFRSCSRLHSVTIPSSVTSIGGYAFFWCKDLTKVAIPNSVTSIGHSVFEYCSSLTSVSIASSVTSLGSFAFYCCSSLKEITIPNSITCIYDMTFCGCTSLTKVTIGSGITSIKDFAFRACTELKNVYSYNPEPPTCNSNTFMDVDVSSVTLYVPYGSKEAYSTADVWKDFHRIGEVDGIDNIVIDNQTEIIGYYSIDGKLFNAPEKGINILRFSDGTTKKIFVK